jgi:hypothetical protein
MSSVRADQEGLVRPGLVLELSASQWKYGDGPLKVRVERERLDLSQYYADERWIEGWRLDGSGVPVEWVQALVPIQVLTQQSNGPRR